MKLGCGIAAILLPVVLTAQPRTCTATGALEIIAFENRVFPAPRSLRILLPDGYRDSVNRTRRYPVLYLNDGQDLFDRCTTLFGGDEWRVDETVRDLIAGGKLPPMIVVGIDNGGRRQRPKEYLAYADEFLSPPEPDPQGKQYPRFLDEVIAFVEPRYRVKTGARNRVLGGSSYGAGAALYALIERPASFDGLLLESPSIYAGDYGLLKDAERVRAWPRRVYIGTGTVREPVGDVEKLGALFRKAGLKQDRLRVVTQPGADHSQSAWGQRLPEALMFLFGTRAAATKH